MDPSANRATDPPANRAPDAVRDLRGGVRLAMDGVRKAIDSAESLQQRMAAVQPPAQGLARGTGTGMGRSMSRMVLRGARGATDLMGSGLDTMLAAVQAALQRPQRERAPTGPQPMMTTS